MDEEHETVETQRLAMEAAHWQRHAARRKRRQGVTRVTIIAGALLLAAFGAGWISHSRAANSGTSACEGITNMYLALTDKYGDSGLSYETGGYAAAIGLDLGAMRGECPGGAWATPHPGATYPARTFRTCQQAYDAFINAQAHINVLADYGTDQLQRELIQTIKATDAYRERNCGLP